MNLQSAVVHTDPDILGGTPVFVGTRVPIKTLLDYLEAGDSLDEFLDHFPGVRREQAIAVLQLPTEEKQEIKMLSQQYIREQIYEKFKAAQQEEQNGKLKFSPRINELRKLIEE